MKDWPPQVPDMHVLWIFYGCLKFTSDLPNKFTEGTDLSIALSQIQMPRKRFLGKVEKCVASFRTFHFSFKAFLCPTYSNWYYTSSLSKLVFLLTNNTCTLLELKKRLFNQLVQLKWRCYKPILNRNKRVTTACVSSTEGAPTVTRSLVSLRDSLNLELTYLIGRKIDIHKTRFPVLS